ncbi:MAG: efflux RND transporter periplasmic adaptor subunit [Gammaproteobacteria bacterium]
MDSRNGLPVLAMFFATLAAAGCSSGQAGGAPSSPPAPEVTSAKVLFNEVRDWADFTGRLEPVERVDIRPRVGGYVEAVGFVEGAAIKKGDLLFQIDPRPFKAAVDRLRADRERAVAELALARSYTGRAQRLLEQRAISQEESEQRVSDASVAEAKLASVRASLDAAELDLSFTHVTAPIAGRISRAVVTVGNLVDASTVLTTVVSVSPVYAYFDIDEQTFLKHTSTGGKADVYVGLIDEEGYPHRAQLDFVDNHVDGNHGTIRARAVLDNTDGRFTPGLFARVRLVSPLEFSAAFVDDRAVGSDLNRKFVFVVDEKNVVRYRPVETGRLIDGLRVVTSGLQANEVVIVNGLQRVRPGVAVAPTQVAMDRSERVLAQLDAGHGAGAVALNGR